VRAIDGRAIAAALNKEVTAAVADLAATGTAPTLAVVVPTSDEAAAWYVRSIARTATKVGITCRVDTLDNPDLGAVTERLDELSGDPTVHGIICQTPLPPGVKLEDVGMHIAPEKDIDGANPISLGRLTVGLPAHAPATAAAVLEILRHEQVPLTGAHAVVVGRSAVVGKPAALLLLAENATVTVCHSRTTDLAAVCAEADVLVAAVGRPGVIGPAHVKPGAVVIDVGTNPTEDGGLVGDVDLQGSEHAAAVTPVPGGVGPVTTMLLMRHTTHAAGADRAG
jgi:methylenetetrahydrofolate dehydrogenase (NADP+) / methenyltetrahydrofolate cyclohydrolase